MGPPTHVVHCHCAMCRRAAGAPVVTFAGFAAERVRFTKGKPKIYRSSSLARRGFCARCGGAMTFQYDARPEQLSFNAGCFDEPGRLKPSHHLYAENMIAWLHMDDGLPRYRGEGGTSPRPKPRRRARRRS
ncbi:MAG: GFA family protein [Alphaproteobacteria bacterium]